MKPRLKMRLGDLLVQETIITEAQLQQATLTLRELDQLAQGLQNKFSSFRT